MAVLVLFYDGVGIGEDDPARNPFAAEKVRRLAPVWTGTAEDGVSFRTLDATLGVPGLPQSATGQTTLFTGVNAAEAAGRHMQGLPGPTLRAILEKESLFLKLVQGGRRPTFANWYTRRHLEAKRPRWSVTTRLVLSASIPFRVLDENGPLEHVLFHDYTGEWIRNRGYPVPLRTADGAAEILAGYVEEHDLVLYEYFLTDVVGHRGTTDERRTHARRVEDLTEAVLARFDLSRHTVLVVSDHGNLEESDHKQHTTNPVPLLGWGRSAEEIVGRVETMMDLTPALVDTPVA
jgi:hypothetical protein